MQLKKWAVRILLGAIMVSGILACQITDQLIAQTALTTPTRTRTRTPRPTFTPIPVATDTATPAPTVPPLPTNPPAPTAKPPTARPLPSATKKPATAVPVAPAPPVVVGPTTSPYQWHANPPGCEHAGGVYVKARVYGDKNNPDSGLEGVKVVLGDGTGNRFDIPPVTTTWDGTYSFTLSPDGAPPFKGKVYVWLIDGSGNRMSDIGGPMNFDGLGPDVGCWHGWVDFWR